MEGILPIQCEYRDLARTGCRSGTNLGFVKVYRPSIESIRRRAKSSGGTQTNCPPTIARQALLRQLKHCLSAALEATLCLFIWGHSCAAFFVFFAKTIQHSGAERHTYFVYIKKTHTHSSSHLPAGKCEISTFKDRRRTPALCFAAHAYGARVRLDAQINVNLREAPPPSAHLLLLSGWRIPSSYSRSISPPSPGSGAAPVPLRRRKCGTEREKHSHR